MREDLKKIKILKNAVIRYRVARAYFSPSTSRPEPLTDEVPWIAPEAIEWLKKYLTKDMTAFEWGSGGSTIFIAKRTKQLTSVEYFWEWYVKVKTYMFLARIFNCKIILKEQKNGTYDDFCKAIDTFPENHFDFILVDGRSRSECTKKAMHKVKIGGYIMLDDSEREQYKSGIDALTQNGFEQIDFYGKPAYQKDPQQTSVFKRTR